MKSNTPLTTTRSGKALRLALFLLLLIYLQTIPSLFSNRVDLSSKGRARGAPEFRIALDGTSDSLEVAVDDCSRTGPFLPDASPMITLAAKAPEGPVEEGIPYEQPALQKARAESARKAEDPTKGSVTYQKSRNAGGSSASVALLANAAAFLVPNMGAGSGAGFGGAGGFFGGGGGGFSGGVASSSPGLVALPIVSP
ncbi:MAG: hypothetical protein ABMA01_07025 [Chthoniobacteraceae bacterium]